MFSLVLVRDSFVGRHWLRWKRNMETECERVSAAGRRRSREGENRKKEDSEGR
jgi:hypothetical protein